MGVVLKSGLGDGAKHHVKQAGKQGGGGHGEHPAGGDIADRGHAQDAAACRHGARDAGTENVGGAYGQSELVGGEDGGHGDDAGAGSLRVGQVVLADFFAYFDHYTLPTDHGAEAQGQRNGHFDPVRNEPGGFVELALVAVKRGGLGGCKPGVVVLRHEPECLAGEVHVVADVGLVFRGNRFERFVEHHFAVYVLDQCLDGDNGGRLQLLGADVSGNFGAGIGTGDDGLVHVLVEDLPRVL